MSSEAKMFVPLENNPEVMTKLAQKLGLSSSFAFHDIYSFTDPDLLGLVPRPVSALLFLYNVTKDSEAHFQSERETFTPHEAAGSVLHFPQTIRHACGLIGMIHCTTNGKVAETLQPDSILAKLMRDAAPLTPDQRAKLLYDSEELEAAHAEAAKEGNSAAPDVFGGEDVNGAFVAFVKCKDGHLWELEGSRKGPVDRGVLAEDEDALCQRALDMGPLQYVRREERAGKGELRFSCLAISPTRA